MEEIRELFERLSNVENVTIILSNSVAEKVLDSGDPSYCEVAC